MVSVSVLSLRGVSWSDRACARGVCARGVCARGARKVGAPCEGAQDSTLAALSNLSLSAAHASRLLRCPDVLETVLASLERCARILDSSLPPPVACVALFTSKSASVAVT